MNDVSHLRIESDGLIGHHTKVTYVGRDGSETDISDVVTGITVEVAIGMGEVNVATLNVTKVKPDIRAISEEIARRLKVVS